MGGALAVDWGTKKSGFAICDALRIAVTPLAALHAPGDGEALVRHVATLLADRDVDTILVGVPRHADGREGERAADARRFVERLRERFEGVEVLERDERLTTKEAEARLAEAGHRGAARRARRDSWAAAVILEDWIRERDRG